MPAIKPNLLLIDADVATAQRPLALTDDFLCRALVASDCIVASKILSEHLIDLIILDRNAIARNKRLNDVVAQFHEIKGQHDVPVLITCAKPSSGVSMKNHPWGGAYHVHKAAAPAVLQCLIQLSLNLKVKQVADKRSQIASTKPILNPHATFLPEVIMPPRASSQR